MQHTFLPELTTVSNTVLQLPLWADWWIPWSSVTREEDLWSMRRSCIMGFWPNGSVPVKRLVTWTLSRPVPMSISISSMEKDGWSWNTVWYPSELLFEIGTETEFLLCCKFRTYLLSTLGYWNWVSALLQIWKLLCPIIYWSNLSTMWTPLITTMLRTIHPPWPIIQVVLPPFPNAWPSWTGNYPRSPPWEPHWQLCSLLCWSYKVGLVVAPIFSCILSSKVTAPQDAHKQ